MPIINGEKYACQSCIKGHRVSGCQHTDRELQHINPKGRPVKQCDHCRNSRKTKSHHARCECGHKKDKAIHKPDDVSGSGCACHTGSKCICGTKKDHGLKLETSGKAKPRLNTTHSESTLTVFANGHHKPCHRLNNSAHTSGMPYKIPRPHTLHGAPIHHSSENVNNFYGMPAQQRSLEGLGIPDNGMAQFAARPRSGESLPLTPIGSADEAAEDFTYDPFKAPFGPPVSSVLGSGPSSPADGSFPTQPPWPWGVTMAPPPQYGYESLSTSPSGEYVHNEGDWAIPSAGLQPSWSATDLPLHPEKFTDTVVQPISHSGDSARASVPGLSTSSSQSEIGEPHFFGELDMKPHNQNLADPIWEDPLQFRGPRSYRGMSNASTPPDLRQAPTSVPTPETQNRTSLDLDFLRRNSPPMAAELETNYLPQRPYSNPLMEAFTQEKMSPAETSYIGTTELDGLPRSVMMPTSVEEQPSGWAAYNDLRSNPFENPEISVYPFGDNFS